MIGGTAHTTSIRNACTIKCLWRALSIIARCECTAYAMLSSRCEPKAAGARFQTKIHGVKVAWFMAAASVYAEQAHSFRVWEAVEASDTLNVGFRLRIS